MYIIYIKTFKNEKFDQYIINWRVPNIIFLFKIANLRIGFNVEKTESTKITMTPTKATRRKFAISTGHIQDVPVK